MAKFKLDKAHQAHINKSYRKVLLWSVAATVVVYKCTMAYFDHGTVAATMVTDQLLREAGQDDAVQAAIDYYHKTYDNK